MRQYLALQAAESGKTVGGNFFGRSGMMPYGGGSMMMGGDQGPQGKVGAYPFQLFVVIGLLTIKQSSTISHVDL